MTTAARGRARHGQGSIKARKLVNGTVVYDAWSPPLIDPVTGKKTRYPNRGLPSETAAAGWIAKTVADNTVHAGGKLMTVDMPKGGRRRRIHLSDETLRLLDAQKEIVERFRGKYGDDRQHHDLVFPRYAQHRITVQPMGGRQNP
jgi:integrase